MSMKDVVGWNEDTGAVAIEDADRRLEGKAVYDALFLEAAVFTVTCFMFRFGILRFLPGSVCFPFRYSRFLKSDCGEI